MISLSIVYSVHPKHTTALLVILRYLVTDAGITELKKKKKKKSRLKTRQTIHNHVPGARDSGSLTAEGTSSMGPGTRTASFAGPGGFDSGGGGRGGGNRGCGEESQHCHGEGGGNAEIQRLVAAVCGIRLGLQTGL